MSDEGCKTLFIGIDLEESLKTEIGRYAESLKKMALKGKWKDPDNYHITIKYLGNTELEKLEKLEEVLRSVKAISFSLSISGLRAFMKNEKTKVVYLGLEGETDALNSVYSQVEEGATSIGFKGERRGYTPHITLGNDISFEMGIEDIEAEAEKPEFQEIEVRSITLFESKREDNRRVYVPLKEFKI